MSEQSGEIQPSAEVVDQTPTQATKNFLNEYTDKIVRSTLATGTAIGIGVANTAIAIVNKDYASAIGTVLGASVLAGVTFHTGKRAYNEALEQLSQETPLSDKSVKHDE